MKNILKSIAVMAVLILTNCNSESACYNGVSGKLIDIGNLDGCKWFIELENGDKLNPLNIETYDIQKSDGLEVSLNFEVLKDVGTICMSGQAVKLSCLKVK